MGKGGNANTVRKTHSSVLMAERAEKIQKSPKFYWASGDDMEEPHVQRRKEIVQAHPEIKKTFWARPFHQVHLCVCDAPPDLFHSPSPGCTLVHLALLLLHSFWNYQPWPNSRCARGKPRTCREGCDNESHYRNLCQFTHGDSSFC
mmetsp:Transcript_8581/g.12635  ORF Transcript_8581/g.12635 Transcript_8581/m.12635 type:complete len:146 (-) Transcript_8581:737-1174(-)